MIVGIGIDLVEVQRIRDLIRRHGNRFIKKIGHPQEIKASPPKEPERSQYWASRFAVKEAFSKALGTGLGQAVSLVSVYVRKEKSGRPILSLRDNLQKLLQKRKIVFSHLSLSHTAEYAVAMVVLENTEHRL